MICDECSILIYQNPYGMIGPAMIFGMRLD